MFTQRNTTEQWKVTILTSNKTDESYKHDAKGKKLDIEENKCMIPIILVQT